LNERRFVFFCWLATETLATGAYCLSRMSIFFDVSLCFSLLVFLACIGRRREWGIKGNKKSTRNGRIRKQ
jgi:hypothetical protein